MKITINDVLTIIEDANEAANKAIEQYKIENPGVDIELLLSGEKGLSARLAQESSREVDNLLRTPKSKG